MYDLIYTDAQRIEQGVLSGYALIMTFGREDNDFECVFSTQNAPNLSAGCLLYAEGTDYGGIIRGKNTSTENGTTTYTGKTWQGVLDEHVIYPPQGQSHLHLTGDAHQALRTIVSSLGLEEWFKVTTSESGILVNTNVRYRNAYSAIINMLVSAGAKLIMKWERDHVELSVQEAITHNQINSSNSEFTIKETLMPPNHLLLLGTGELLDRAVSDLYIDQNGEITTTQYYFGLDEITAKYEDTNASLSELIEKGEKKLSELQEGAEVDVSSDLVDDYDVGDFVTVVNLEASQSATAAVTSKTVTLIDGEPTFSCDIGSISALYDISNFGGEKQ